MKTRAGLILVALVITALSVSLFQPTIRVRANLNIVRYASDLLKNNWQANYAFWPHCAGVFYQNPLAPSFEIQGFTTIDGGCYSGNDGVSIRTINSPAGLPASMYVTDILVYMDVPTSGTIIINGGGFGIASVPTPTPSPTGIVAQGGQAVYDVKINGVMTNDIQVFFAGDRSCAWFLSPPSPGNLGSGATTCPFITGVDIEWLDSTATPGGVDSPTPSSTFWPTNAPSSTFLPSPTGTPANTPTTINTVQAGPLSTIASLENCSGDPFNPCGTMPYQIVMLPTIDLPSPTAWPTVPSSTPIPITATPSPTITPTTNLTVTATYTPSPTGLATVPYDPSSGLATLVNSNFSTLVPLGNNFYTINGTPVGVAGIAQKLGGTVGQAIGLVNALSMVQLGTAGNILGIFFLIFVLMVIVEVLTLVLPIILAIIRFILQAIAALKPF